MLMDGLTRDAMALVRDDKLEKILNLIGEDDLQNVINNGDVKAAEKIIELYVRPNLSSETLEMLDMCEEALPKYSDIRKEWGV